VSLIVEAPPHDHQWEPFEGARAWNIPIATGWRCTVSHCKAVRRLTKRQFIEAKRQMKADQRMAARVWATADRGKNAKARNQAREDILGAM